MKYFLFLSLLFVSFSCKLHHTFSLTESTSPRYNTVKMLCISDNQLLEIEKQIKKNRQAKCDYYVIARDIVSIQNDTCVGLFCIETNTCNKKFWHYIPMLKFADKVEFNFNPKSENIESEYHGSDSLKVKMVVDDFIVRYGDLFNDKELNEIRRKFINGVRYGPKGLPYWL